MLNSVTSLFIFLNIYRNILDLYDSALLEPNTLSSHYTGYNHDNKHTACFKCGL